MNRRPGARFTRGRIATDVFASSPILTHAQNYGSALLQLITANAPSITQSAGAVSQWDDSSGNGRHYTQATGAAQPAYNAADGSVGSHDGVLTGLDYVRFDGSSDFIDSVLNLPAPGTTPTFFFLVVRQYVWQNLDRILASVGTVSVMILYQTPTSPTLATFNAAGPANDNVGPRATPITNDWMLVMGTWSNTVGSGTWPNQAGDWLMVKNALVAAENAGNSSSTGRRIGQDVSGSRFAAIDLYELGYVQGLPTAAQLQNTVDYYNSILPPGIAWKSRDINAICEGDSQTNGDGGGFSITPWPTFLSVPPRKLKVENVATGGETTANTQAQYAAQVGARYNAGTAPAINNFQIYWCGTNDLVALSTTDPDPSGSAATIWARIKSSLDAWHTAGGKNIVMTLPRGNYAGTRETSRLALNVLIRAAVGSEIDGLVELADNGIEGDPIPAGAAPNQVHSDGVYLLDGFHVSTLVQETIVAVRANAALAAVATG